MTYFKKLNVNNREYFYLKLTVFGVTCWVLFLLFHFATVFSGDGEIHLIFAEHFLNGYFLEFNRGYKTGGETSLLYFSFITLLYYFFGIKTAFAMKAIGISSLITAIFFINRTSRNDNKYIRTLFTLIPCSMPFIIFQSWIGMENIIFALLMIVNIHTNIKCGFQSKFIPIFKNIKCFESITTKPHR